MLDIIAHLVAAVQVPVTADIEAGYGPTPEEVTRTIRGVIAAGAVGVNLEDNTGLFQPLYTLEQQTERIAAARRRPATLISLCLSMLVSIPTSVRLGRRRPAWTKPCVAPKPLFGGCKWHFRPWRYRPIPDCRPGSRDPWSPQPHGCTWGPDEAWRLFAKSRAS